MPNIKGIITELEQNKTYSRDEPLNKRKAFIEYYQKKYVEKRKKKIKKKYAIDDKVLVYKEGMKHTLGTNWENDYKISKILENDSYVVFKNVKYYR
ncbi:hypothetical protein COBT_002731, partial [Conglomerata obtusa]